MATPRNVSQVLPTVRTLEGAGFSVRRPFPTEALDHHDPFLLLDEMGPMELAPGEAKGAPDHPHRGFETVTYLIAGEFEHEDSMGNSGRLRAGDVQWMTAGDGVIHSEMPSQKIVSEGGRLHGFQLWVNLPRRDKRMQPRYQDVPAARIPEASSADGLAKVRVIAGEALGARAVIETRTPILYLHFTLRPGARVAQAVPAGMRGFAYVFSGEARVGANTRVVRDGEAAFLADGDEVELAVPADAKGPAEVLLIAGQPLREPVARYGPFVMSSRDELVEAFEDYQRGRFGKIAARVG
jgi:redox-sensitive bicupin YhaK (pirin superfamily)